MRDIEPRFPGIATIQAQAVAIAPRRREYLPRDEGNAFGHGPPVQELVTRISLANRGRATWAKARRVRAVGSDGLFLVEALGAARVALEAAADQAMSPPR
jgi:hypothetical protein